MAPIILEERIRSNYNELTKSCKKIAEYLLRNMEKAAFFNISDFRREIGVSETTVMRFARALGYDGFPQLQEDLRTWFKEKFTPLKKMEKSLYKPSSNMYKNILDKDIQNLNYLKEGFSYEKLGKVVNMILKAKHVYIMGYRTSYPLAYFLYMFLTHIMKNVELLDVGGGSIYDRIIQWGRDDVLVAISFSRYSRITLEIAECAKNQHCKIIGITDRLISPVGNIATYVLTAPCNSPTFFNSYTAVLSLINCLVGEISIKKGKDSIRLLRNRDNVFKQLRVLLK